MAPGDSGTGRTRAMTAMFGSVGAGAVMRAVNRRYPCRRLWFLDKPGAQVLQLTAGEVHPGWWVFVGEYPEWKKINRDTARLLLRGLLAEQVAGEFVAWLESETAASRTTPWRVAMASVLDHLYAMGVPKHNSNSNSDKENINE